MQTSNELQPLTNMEELLHVRADSAEGSDSEISSDLPPLDWIHEMIETLTMLVEYGDENNAYDCCDHASNRDEMVEFVKTAPGTHPTWKTFRTWALSALDSIEE